MLDLGAAQGNGRPTGTSGEWRDSLRTRGLWLMALPFLYFSEPFLASLQTGALVAAAGLALRAWAAGVIRKGERLATHGPYALVRHPLYLGGFLLGVGVTVAGGHWIFPVTYVVFFARTYPATIRAEESFLERTFGAEYIAYRARVPALCPTLRPSAAVVGVDFRLERYMANHEYNAVFGLAAVFAWLAAKMVLLA